MSKARGQVLKVGRLAASLLDEALRTGLPNEVAVETVFGHLVNKAAALRPSLAEDPKFRHRLVFAERWVRSGANSLTAGHRLAASMMATALPMDAIGDVKHPWPAYCVAVPAGMLAFKCHPENGGVDCFIDHLQIGQMRTENGQVLSIGVFCSHLASISMTHFENGMLGEQVSFAIENVAAYADDWPGEAVAAAKLSLRFALGLLVHLEASGQFSKCSQGRSPKSKRGDPACFTYQVTGDVKVDCREWAQTYVSSCGSSPFVQCMVRGHWKRQAWGPGGQLRKWIHVEPYWRGPEDAPIAVRSHVIEGRP